MSVKQISATELNNKIQNEEALFLLDVREPNEFQYARIDKSVLIPLNQIPQRIGELDPQQNIVVICHHGVRSRQVAYYLERAGFRNVVNLEGGVDAWARDVDPHMPTY